MKTCMKLFLMMLGVMTLGVNTALAQNVASNKAYFGSGYDTLSITSDGTFNGGAPILQGQLKTSAVGDLMMWVSLECALITNTRNKVNNKTDTTSTSTSRAAVNLTVMVDGVVAAPGQVVFCDRLQQVKLTFTCAECESTSSIDLEIFQSTKNANHFNFYLTGVGNGIHDVQVFASALITDDPTVTLSAGTQAAIGKRSLIIQEFNSSN